MPSVGSGEEVHCACAPSGDSKSLAFLLQEYGIAPSDLERERRRVVVRQRLRLRRGLLAGLFGGLVVASFPLLDRQVFPRRTWLNTCALGVGVAVLMLLAQLVLRRVARRWEDRILAAKQEGAGLSGS